MTSQPAESVGPCRSKPRRQRPARALASPGRLLARRHKPHGSVEEIARQGVDLAAPLFEDWLKAIERALRGKTTARSIRAALRKAQKRLETADLVELVEEAALRSSMIGAEDAHSEMRGRLVDPAKFARVPDFELRPFAAAIEKFVTRDIVTRGTFDRMSAEARARAFTVAGMASDRMVADVHSELHNALAAGEDLRKFRNRLRDRPTLQGWLKEGPATEAPTRPGTPWHIETIFRNGTMGSYGQGRVSQMSQPSVMAARPYWQCYTVQDARVRKTHSAMHLKALKADDPFWQGGAPPWGHNCRCRIVSRSKAEVESRGIEVITGSSVTDLPDPGWTGKSAFAVGAVEEPAEPKKSKPKRKKPKPAQPRSPKPAPRARQRPPGQPKGWDQIHDPRERLKRIPVEKGRVMPEDAGMQSDRTAPKRIEEMRKRAGIDPRERLLTHDFVSTSRVDASELIVATEKEGLSFKHVKAETHNADSVVDFWHERSPAVYRIDGKLYVDPEHANKVMAARLHTKSREVRVRVLDLDYITSQPDRMKPEQAKGRLAKLGGRFTSEKAREARRTIRDFADANYGIKSNDVYWSKAGADKIELDSHWLQGGRARACHGWDGQTDLKKVDWKRIRKAAELKEPPTLFQNNLEAEAIHSFIHEEMHGCSGLAQRAYQAHGAAAEEVVTELVARRMSRDLLRTATGDPDVALFNTLKIVKPKSGKPYVPTVWGGSYDMTVSDAALAVHRATGKVGREVGELLEDAALRVRQKNTHTFYTEDDALRVFVDEIDVTPKERADIFEYLKKAWTGGVRD
jgi:SPP1 gp7 family putative phage head morphogenesis protein